MARIPADFDFVVPEPIFKKALIFGRGGCWLRIKEYWGVKTGDCIVLRSSADETKTQPYMVTNDVLERENEKGEVTYYLRVKAPRARRVQVTAWVDIKA